MYVVTDPVQVPLADISDDSNDNHGQDVVGSLNLDDGEGPIKHGTPCDSSVRFDVSAIQGSSWPKDHAILGNSPQFAQAVS